MEALIEKAVLLALGGLGTLAFFLIKRWLTKDHESEAIRRASEAADLTDKLRQRGLSMSEVRSVMIAATQKAGPEPAPEQLLYEDAVEAREIAEINAARTTAEMNSAQGRRTDRLKAKVDEAVMDIQYRLRAHADLLAAFDRSHALWEQHVEAEAELAALPWQGGSMTSFIVLGTLARLYRQRAEELRIMLQEPWTDTSAA